MTGALLGGTSLAIVLFLIALRVPIGVALGSVAFGGFWYMRGWNTALGQLREVPYNFAANWDLSAIPMFLLMGSIVAVSGTASALFRAARLWLAPLPGGLAVATNMACAGFAAGCGSSVAASATMGRIAIPEMLKAGYEKGLAAGTVASAGTIAALIPPSILLVLFGVFAEVSITGLLIAGVIPGLLTAALYSLMILIRCWRNPALAPRITLDDEPDLARERWRALAEIWPIALLMVGIVTALYSGTVTPTEVGAAGAFLALLIAMVQRKMNIAKFVEALRDSMAVTAQIFFVGFGALLYTRFLALTGLSRMLSDTLAPMGLDPLLVMLAVTVIFLILGMFLDPIGIMLITMPVFVPLMNAMGMDLIWFGVLVVKFIEIGMLSPPLGFNVYVVKSVVGDAIPISRIFRGVGWFLVCDMVVVLLMILFPAIVLFLPNLMRG